MWIWSMQRRHLLPWLVPMGPTLGVGTLKWKRQHPAHPGVTVVDLVEDVVEVVVEVVALEEVVVGIEEEDVVLEGDVALEVEDVAVIVDGVEAEDVVVTEVVDSVAPR